MKFFRAAELILAWIIFVPAVIAVSIYQNFSDVPMVEAFENIRYDAMCMDNIIKREWYQL